MPSATFSNRSSVNPASSGEGKAVGVNMVVWELGGTLFEHLLWEHLGHRHGFIHPDAGDTGAGFGDHFSLFHTLGFDDGITGDGF